MKVQSISNNSYIQPNQRIRLAKMQNPSFKGDEAEEILSEGLKEFVGDAIPCYRTVRVVNKIKEGDKVGLVKQGVGIVDNIVLQPAKQTAASAVAAKSAAVGTAILPGVGTAVGACIGYFGTLLLWGKTRNSIVGKMMK